MGHPWGVTDYGKGRSLPLSHPAPPLSFSYCGQEAVMAAGEGLTEEGLSPSHSHRPPQPPPLPTFTPSLADRCERSSFVPWILSNLSEDI